MVAVAFFLPGRAKDLSAPRYFFFCLHLWFYPIFSLLFLLLLTFAFHTFLRFYIYLISILPPITFSFFLCLFLHLHLFHLTHYSPRRECLVLPSKVSMRSVAHPVVAATRKPCSCQNGGMCHLKRRACHCPPGYFGRRCERVSCKPGCLNGGHCREPDQCVCPSHYSGLHCETRKCRTRTKTVEFAWHCVNKLTPELCVPLGRLQYSHSNALLNINFYGTCCTG